MAIERSEASGGPEAGGYQVELVPLARGTEEASSVLTLQQAVYEGARQSWKLVGIAQDPVSQGVLVVWEKPDFRLKRAVR